MKCIRFNYYYEWSAKLPTTSGKWFYSLFSLVVLYTEERQKRRENDDGTGGTVCKGDTPYRAVESGWGTGLGSIVAWHKFRSDYHAWMKRCSTPNRVSPLARPGLPFIALDTLISTGFDSSPWGAGSIPRLRGKNFLTWMVPGLRTGSGGTYAQMLLALNGVHCDLQLEGGIKKGPLHCKKESAIFPSPAGMSLTKLSLGGKKLNYSRPGRVWSVTSQLGTGKRLTLFYSVEVKKEQNH